VGSIAVYLLLSRRDQVDWKALRRVGSWYLLGVFVALAPASVSRAAVALGAGLVAGMVVRARVLPAAARSVRIPGVDLDRVAAWWFRKRYQRRARELGWDKNRRGARDRMAVPALVEARRRDGDWTFVFLSRGDWTPEEWEKQAYALSRDLDGRSVRLTHEGRRVIVQVWTRELPGVGELKVTEPPRITPDGILLGHDSARREVRWAADDQSAHQLIVGVPGGGKSHLAGLELLQAAATSGWEAELLDAKETTLWLWLQRYGVKVLNRRGDIHKRLAWLEGERQRIEHAGETGEVRRLVVLDEARLILGTHKGADLKQRQETIGVVGDLTGLGRSAGIRMVVMIQRPDVEHVGGGYLRDNIPCRAGLGRLHADGADMAFDGYTVHPQELRGLNGFAGRGLVAGLRGGQTDAFLIQVPELAVPHERGGGAGDASPAGPVTPAPGAPLVGDTGDWTVPMMVAAIERVVPPGEERRRTFIAREVGVPSTHQTLRRAVDLLEAERGWSTGTGPRGAVTVIRPAAGGEPARGDGRRLHLVTAAD
jgi:hypothetical protein